jgi:hypothetical protein
MKSAELFAFPAERRGALVKRTAHDLHKLNGEEANLYFRWAARSLYQELVAHGLGDSDARSAVLRFSDAVQAVLREALPLPQSIITA